MFDKYIKTKENIKKNNLNIDNFINSYSQFITMTYFFIQVVFIFIFQNLVQSKITEYSDCFKNTEFFQSIIEKDILHTVTNKDQVFGFLEIADLINLSLIKNELILFIFSFLFINLVLFLIFFKRTFFLNIYNKNKNKLYEHFYIVSIIYSAVSFFLFSFLSIILFFSNQDSFSNMESIYNYFYLSPYLLILLFFISSSFVLFNKNKVFSLRNITKIKNENKKLIIEQNHLLQSICLNENELKNIIEKVNDINAPSEYIKNSEEIFEHLKKIKSQEIEQKNRINKFNSILEKSYNDKETITNIINE